MAYLLNIHTATETAIINLMENEKVLDSFSNTDTKQHASFLHTSIKKLLQQHDIPVKDLAAIGVTSGPGSYTGIRVGLSAAKGLCYALKIPLITFNSLEIMAISAADFAGDPNALYCPMIDARRMEVYTAVYNYTMEEIMAPSATILTQTLFTDLAVSDTIFFSGSGSNKFKQISKRTNAIFLNLDLTTQSLATIAWKKYAKDDYANITYATPLYMK